MGDGPKDEQTEAMSEVPSEAPGESKAPSDGVASKDSAVDDPTMVLRLPPRVTAGDAPTRVMRQVPPIDPAAEAEGEGGARADTGAGAGAAGKVASPDSPTQVVPVVPPKAPSPSAQTATPAAESGSGPNVDGPPTTVLRPVVGKRTTGDDLKPPAG
ncbi:MAG TPA: hypothetical protein VIQ30_04760, partial [Pseudonocardia sp.]